MWSRFPTEIATLALAVSLAAACSSAPTAPDSRSGTPAPTASPPAASTSGEDDSIDTIDDAQGAAGSALPPTVVVPERAASEFARAVELMRAGNSGEAELEFQQLAAGYPQLAGPHVNLGILYRKAGKLDPAVESLRAAVERNPASAVAWNELGVTLRLRGNFQDSAAAYERAIAADPAYAPAHRNLGVLRDLYLGDANGALDSLERYKSLTRDDDKTVNGWLAELRQRTGRSAPAPAAPPAPAPETTPAPESGTDVADEEEPAAAEPPSGEGATR
jgi:tetratricopeptide (TPR) repeat protein